MSEDRCICCGEIVPEGRMVCPNCEKQKPMKNLSHGEMVQIAEGKKKPMPRYIDADKLLQELEDRCEDCLVDNAEPWCKHNCEYADLLLRLDHMPDADVVERKKGKWRVYEGEMTCSCCETTFYTDMCEYIDGNVPKFCPWCGADMREERIDE